jgi:hypothetical protein
MKTGDRVVLTSIPPDVGNLDDLRSRELFEKCLGKAFVISALKHPGASEYPLMQLDVGQVSAKPAYMDTIWVEPQYLRLE